MNVRAGARPVVVTRRHFGAPVENHSWGAPRTASHIVGSQFSPGRELINTSRGDSDKWEQRHNFTGFIRLLGNPENDNSKKRSLRKLTLARRFAVRSLKRGQDL